MLVPAHLIDGWSFEPESNLLQSNFLYGNLNLKRGPCRKPSPTVTHWQKALRHQRMFVLDAVGRLEASDS